MVLATKSSGRRLYTRREGKFEVRYEASAAGKVSFVKNRRSTSGLMTRQTLLSATRSSKKASENDLVFSRGKISTSPPRNCVRRTKRASALSRSRQEGTKSFTAYLYLKAQIKFCPEARAFPIPAAFAGAKIPFRWFFPSGESHTARRGVAD